MNELPKDFPACNRRLDEVDMDIVVFTNMSAEAAEAAGQSPEEMLEAQARLLRRLTDPTRQRAIINLDGELSTSCPLPDRAASVAVICMLRRSSDA